MLYTVYHICTIYVESMLIVNGIKEVKQKTEH